MRSMQPNIHDRKEVSEEMHKQPQTSPWLTVKEAAAYVGFCEKTIRRACALSGLRHVRMGRSIRIQRAWLDEWLLARENQAA